MTVYLVVITYIHVVMVLDEAVAIQPSICIVFSLLVFSLLVVRVGTAH
jgi:hypothetical protein